MKNRWVITRLNISKFIHSLRRISWRPFSRVSTTDQYNIIDENFDPQSKYRAKNLVLKSKLLILLGFIFIGISLFLSKFYIFTLDNYNQYVQSSYNLNLYLSFNKRFQGFKEFNNVFQAPNQRELYINQNGVNNEFNYNYSSIALISYINEIYKTQKSPKEYLINQTIDFHWGDWVDTSRANPFIKMYPDLLKRFGNSQNEVYNYYKMMCQFVLEDKIPDYEDQQLFQNLAYLFEQVEGVEICGAIDKYYYFPVPERIMLETDYHYHVVGVNPRRLDEPLGIEGLAKRYHNSKSVTSKQIKAIDPNDGKQIARELKGSYLSKGYEFSNFKLQRFINQDPLDFREPNVLGEIKELERNKFKLTQGEQKRLDFLHYSNEHLKERQPFFFKTVMVNIDNYQAVLHHYNYPWMRKILCPEERIKIIHHMIRSWFKFAEQAQVISWFNYGNLYGWYFNGQNLPWDNDVDVQISVQDQDKLGQYYNNTLVIENPDLGDHVFLYQTNPWYLQPHYKQHIDSRYIDVRSGIYIDISCLWLDQSIEHYDKEDEENEEKAKKEGNDTPEKALRQVHCKNNRRFPLDDLFPLRRTLFEGAQGYMPYKPKKVLWDTYGKGCTDKKYNKDHNWQKDIGMWIQNQICENEKIPKTGDRFDDNGDLTLSGACNDTEILEIFKLSHDQYQVHLKEFDIVVGKGEDGSEFSEDELPIYRFYDSSEFQ
ncbi:hypothetical protein BN7_1932 [Wickerhamomyces ciferrii]|uniref:LicD/FKTN/FKRP nucleotidyltransferase domain-containing protein n=1 Tax=Wickerhamomyces ciferrii (strain ATCC 14091 / BCRC 22168 / CBS 111 / JCM 3599 / NBRC 0793 / NRRL Y-1031 F-60-10) TaxID=1206466 RepID=K0KJS0_WICCF|nr:uncharacterized protein BN7_1932 [Wickerhamomyces ciferrii]CCH42387.1 hypothetical protein BN7_1932 [Wickerhamomyces ciferrii]